MMGPGGKVAPEFLKLNKLAIALGIGCPVPRQIFRT